MKKIVKFLSPIAGLFLLAGTAFAAADPDVASVSQVVIDKAKDNFVGVLNENIVAVGTLIGIFVGIPLLWKLIRKFIGR